ncbi:MAG: metallophosphoesterase family protein [Phycisphaeraceae bacterium]
MFDRSLLPPAESEFVVVADTHYMLDTTGKAVEFESRRKQSARAETALRQIAALAPPFVIHLGDIAQEYPETARYMQALNEAKAQLDAHCPVRHHVVGNQDIGDKPDPTTPGFPVTEAALNTWESHFGPTWFSFDHDGIHFVVLNSQILNTALPQAQEQRDWLERDLAEAHGKRICLFLHLPLFLFAPDEPHLGHYDNVGQDDRAWLIELIQRHRVQWMMSGHVHFPFYQRIGEARYLISQAPSFTRPGFSHLFSSPPPADQGRDQSQVLGFYLMRVMPDRFDAHLVRTGGDTELPEPLQRGWQRVLTRTPKALPDGRLGVTLRHPLSWTTQVPTAWPSAIRQPVRNDLPLLACVELGVRHVRVPLADCENKLQKERLAVLRDEGVRVIATAMAADPAVTRERLDAARKHADQIELQIINDELDDTALVLCAADLGPVSLSAVTSRQPVPGKQHPRTRHGFLPEHLPALNERLAKANVSVAGVLCRLDPAATDINVQPLSHIPQIDLAFEFQPGDVDNVAAATRALLAAHRLGAGHLFFEPMIDMDRTMDAAPGLLDTQCNPRPVFHALRCVNTLCNASDQMFELWRADDDRGALERHLANGSARVYRLERAMVKTCDARDADELAAALDAGETLLIGGR